MADKTFENYVEERAAVTIADADEFVVRDDSAVDVKKITSSNLKTAMGLQHNGSNAAPSYSFSSDTDTGMYWKATNEVGFATGGTENLRLTGSNLRMASETSAIYNTGYFRGVAATGTASSPTYSWDGDTDTGMYSDASNSISFATAGVQRLDVDGGGIKGKVTFQALLGSAAAPGFAFDGDTDTGMYRVSANKLGFSAGDTLGLTVSASQTRVQATSIQGLVIDTTAANGPYIDLLEGGVRQGYIGFPGSSSLYLTNAKVGGAYRMPQMGALTTASAANVFFNTSNSSMYRSTSSLKYKTDVEDLDLASARKALSLRPIWYRSLGDDRKDWSFYGLGAEEVAEVDPRIVEFAPTPNCECSLSLVSHPILEDGEPFTVDDRNLEDHTDDCLKPLNVQYSRLVPHLIRLAQDQEERITALEARLATAGL